MKSWFVIRDSWFVVLLVTLISCGQNESLTEDEQKFVHTSVALAKAKVRAIDSADLVRIQDSIYKRFATTPSDFTQVTLSFSKRTERAPLVFRAIEDSLED
jgi:hypothetical protein